MSEDPLRARVEHAATSVLGSGLSVSFPRDEMPFAYVQQVVDELLGQWGHERMLLVKETDRAVVVERSPAWAGSSPEEGFRH
jgi:hypothetical protein